MLPINWKTFQAFNAIWAHSLRITIAGLYQPSSELNTIYLMEENFSLVNTKKQP